MIINMSSTPFILITIISFYGVSGTDYSCVTQGKTFTCNYSVPEVIPPKVTCVQVNGLKYRLQTENFADESWKVVVSLNIGSNIHFYVNTSVFAGLKNLSNLGLHVENGVSVNEKIFECLDNLRVLNLSDSRHWYWSMSERHLEHALMVERILPKIEILDLTNVGNFGGQPLFLNTEFTKMIISKGIKKLIFGNQVILVAIDFEEIFVEMHHNCPFNLSSIQASSTYAIVKKIGQYSWKRYFHKAVYLLQNIKEMTLSEMTFHFEQPKPKLLCRPESENNAFVTTIIMGLAEFSIFRSTGLKEAISLNIDATACSFMKLKILRVKHSDMEKVNVTLLTPNNTIFEEIDFSFNQLSYVRFSGNFQIQRFILSNNIIHKMNHNTELDFAFRSLSKLEYLDLSSNGFRSLPRQVFSGNPNLRMLLLKDNRLTSIDFVGNHLKSLKLLNLQNNQIKILDSSSMHKIEHIHQASDAKVNLYFNPLECSCKATEFIKWVSKLSYKKDGLTCVMEGSVAVITIHTYHRCKYLCYKNIVHTMIGVVSLFLLIGTILLVRKCYLHLYQAEYEKNKHMFIQDFNKRILYNNKDHACETAIDLDPIEFILILAHHDTDYEFCRDKIYNPLKDGLKGLLSTELQTICFGLENENPGHTKQEEMESLTSKSCVYFCVVSENFCSDQWCQIELENAFLQNKPIVFLLTGDVNKFFSPYMKVLSRRAYISKLEDLGSLREFNWNKLCEAILKIAVISSTKMSFSISKCFDVFFRMCYKKISKTQGYHTVYEHVELKESANLHE